MLKCENLSQPLFISHFRRDDQEGDVSMINRPMRLLSKDLQRKNYLMAWFKPYMDMKPDHDAHRIWEELSWSAGARNWAEFRNVICGKWAEIHPDDKETTTFLDDFSHCRNIWDIFNWSSSMIGRKP